MNDDIIGLVKEVIELLVHGRYKQVADWSNGISLSEVEISTAIAEYEHTLVSPPDIAYKEFLYSTHVRESDPPRWIIDMPLWTKEEGRSDLEICLSIIKWPKKLAFEVNSILVP